MRCCLLAVRLICSTRTRILCDGSHAMYTPALTPVTPSILLLQRLRRPATRVRFFLKQVYVDGSHHARDVLQDAVLAWGLLRPGGYMIFDDYGWVSNVTLDKPHTFSCVRVCLATCFFQSPSVIRRTAYTVVTCYGLALTVVTGRRFRTNT